MGEAGSGIAHAGAVCAHELHAKTIGEHSAASRARPRERSCRARRPCRPPPRGSRRRQSVPRLEGCAVTWPAASRRARGARPASPLLPISNAGKSYPALSLIRPDEPRDDSSIGERGLEARDGGSHRAIAERRAPRHRSRPCRRSWLCCARPGPPLRQVRRPGEGLRRFQG